MDKIEKYMKQTLKNRVKITKAAIIAILITGGITAPKIAKANTPNDVNKYYSTNENENHGLELGDNSQARGKGSIVTSENGIAIGNGAVATGGDNTSKEDIERKLKENQEKLNEIERLKKKNIEITKQLNDLKLKEQDVIQAGIRVEELRKARAAAEKEAEKLRNAWQTEVNGSEEFFKKHQAKIDDLNSRLTGVGNLINKGIETPEGLEKAVNEFKQKVEHGTSLNLSKEFYKDYITSYYKALGDLRLNNAINENIGKQTELPNGKNNTIKNIIDANFLNRDLKDIVIQYYDRYLNYSDSSSSSSSSSSSDASSSSSSSGAASSSSYYSSGDVSSASPAKYNCLGEYSVDENGVGRVNGLRKGGYHKYNGELIKTYKNVNSDLTNQDEYNKWKRVKDGWKAQIHDANKRSGSEFFGKFDTLTNGKSTILFNMVTDMKFELVDLDYEITYSQWKYEQTHDKTWLDKKKEYINKRQEKLDTNEKIIKDKYKELFGEDLAETSKLFNEIGEKIKNEWKKENIDDIKNKNKITTEKLTSELEQALGVNKNAIKERQEKLDRMKSEYEQADRNAKGLNPSEKDLLLSKEYEKVKAEIEQMTKTLKENQEKLKALKEALTLYDLKNKGKDNIAYGTDTLAIGDNAIAMGKGTKTVGKNSISFGVDLLTTGKDNTNIGQLSLVTGEKNQVIGYNNKVKGDQNLVFGNNVTIDNINNAMVFGNESKAIGGAVSFGNDTVKRQLKFVGEGTDDTDAVNVSQLKKTSPYYIWKNLKENKNKPDNEETKKEFLASLKGADGKNGANGTNGDSTFAYYEKVVTDSNGNSYKESEITKVDDKFFNASDKVVKGADGKIYKAADIKGRTYDSKTNKWSGDTTQPTEAKPLTEQELSVKKGSTSRLIRGKDDKFYTESMLKDAKYENGKYVDNKGSEITGGLNPKDVFIKALPEKNSMVLSNIGEGKISKDSTDAINGSQLFEKLNGKLNVDADNLSKNGETNLINKLSNGSDISKPNNRLVTDKQVNDYLSKNYYNKTEVDAKVSNISNTVVEANKKSELALGGVANAVAMANLPQVASYGKYKHMLTAAYGNYAGVNALALGFSGTTDSRRITYKISGSVNTQGNLAFGGGIGIMLGNKEERNTDKLEKLNVSKLHNRIDELEKDKISDRKEIENLKRENQEIKEMLKKIFRK